MTPSHPALSRRSSAAPEVPSGRRPAPGDDPSSQGEKPSAAKPASVGKYVYAIAALGDEQAYDFAGIDGRRVFAVSNGRVGAIVSDCYRPRIRPERAHLAAHREVLKRLMADATVLPMAFGIIADDLKAVRRLLALNQPAFLEQLRRVAGKLELGLRVVWDVPNIFDYFVDRHPELRAARDRLIAGRSEARQEDKIELGRFFERLLNEDREELTGLVEEALAPCCREIKRAPPRAVNEVANLSLLVRREDQPAVEAAVFKAAAEFDNAFAFDLNGPWAPHSFVELELQLDRGN